MENLSRFGFLELVVSVVEKLEKDVRDVVDVRKLKPVGKVPSPMAPTGSKLYCDPTPALLPA